MRRPLGQRIITRVTPSFRRGGSGDILEKFCRACSHGAAGIRPRPRIGFRALAPRSPPVKRKGAAAVDHPTGQAHQMPVAPRGVLARRIASATRITRPVKVAIMNLSIMAEPRRTPSATSLAETTKQNGERMRKNAILVCSASAVGSSRNSPRTYRPRC